MGTPSGLAMERARPTATDRTASPTPTPRAGLLKQQQQQEQPRIVATISSSSSSPVASTAAAPPPPPLAAQATLQRARSSALAAAAAAAAGVNGAPPLLSAAHRRRCAGGADDRGSASSAHAGSLSSPLMLAAGCSDETKLARTPLPLLARETSAAIEREATGSGSDGGEDRDQEQLQQQQPTAKRFGSDSDAAERALLSALLEGRADKAAEAVAAIVAGVAGSASASAACWPAAARRVARRALTAAASAPSPAEATTDLERALIGLLHRHFGDAIKGFGVVSVAAASKGAPVNDLGVVVDDDPAIQAGARWLALLLASAAIYEHSRLLCRAGWAGVWVVAAPKPGAAADSEQQTCPALLSLPIQLMRAAGACADNCPLWVLQRMRAWMQRTTMCGL